MSLLLAWIVSITSGLEPIILKASSKNLIRSPWLFNFLWISSAYPLIVPFAIMHGAHWPVNWMTFVWLGLFHAGFFLLFTAAIYKIDTSTVTPLFALRTVFGVLLSVFVLGEHFTLLKFILIGVIVLASPLTSYDEHRGLKAFRQKYVLLAVLAMASLALAGYFTNRAYAQSGYASTVLWQDTFTFMFLAPSLFFVKWKQESWNARKFLPFVLLALVGFIYVAGTAAAFGQALGLSTVIVSLPISMILVWLIGLKYPNWLEYHPHSVYMVRFSGAFVMVACAIALSFV
ncbi:MAG TPA: EamA family transporter [Candidatus Saccharimonadales bacterium]|nr:EamA family transporter [Candidatus Saccharimonadales bacterium]